MSQEWERWCGRSRLAAENRWKMAEGLNPPQRKGKDWERELRKRLVELQTMEILQPGEHTRLQPVDFSKLAKSDQKRLKEAGKSGKHLYAIGLAGRGSEVASEESTLTDRTLRLTDGRHLQAGRLNLQVFVDDNESRLLGMNIQLRGRRDQRPIYMRYDLDAVQMGKEKGGAVTHFRAHWHLGEDPDASESEDKDPRLASLVLDPTAVVDILVETFFPTGPADVVKVEQEDSC